MKQWEYLVIEDKDWYLNLSKILNLNGKNGWELVSYEKKYFSSAIPPEITIIFKKPLDSTKE